MVWLRSDSTIAIDLSRWCYHFSATPFLMLSHSHRIDLYTFDVFINAWWRENATCRTNTNRYWLMCCIWCLATHFPDFHINSTLKLDTSWTLVCWPTNQRPTSIQFEGGIDVKIWKMRCQASNTTHEPIPISISSTCGIFASPRIYKHIKCV